MTMNPVFRHHFIRGMVNKKKIKLDFINTCDQPANVLTIVVSADKIQQFKKFLKITNEEGVKGLFSSSRYW